MAYVGFDDKGYYFGYGNTLLFSSDNTHNDLFNYITKDLRHLPDLFDKYISNRIDTTAFKLKNYKKNDDLNEIIENIKPIHPYFEYNYEEDLKNKIGNYFNQLLVYTIKKKDESLYKKAIKKKWYIDNFTKLMSPSFSVDDIYCDTFFNKFQIAIGERNKDTEGMSINIPPQKPSGFADEIATQKAVYNILYFILDISAPDINELTIPQRTWLYGNIFNITAVSATQRFSFLPPAHFYTKQDYTQKFESLRKIGTIFEPLNALNKLNVGHDGIPADMVNNFKSAIEHAKTIAKTKIYEEYEITNLRELLYLEIMSMIQSGTMIRKCKNCERYFVVNNRKIAYCDRPDESGNPGSVVGS